MTALKQVNYPRPPISLENQLLKPGLRPSSLEAVYALGALHTTLRPSERFGRLVGTLERRCSLQSVHPPTSRSTGFRGQWTDFGNQTRLF
jgi:hypothetical protein